jgi:hypothetical protein
MMLSTQIRINNIFFEKLETTVRNITSVHQSIFLLCSAIFIITFGIILINLLQILLKSINTNMSILNRPGWANRSVIREGRLHSDDLKQRISNLFVRTSLGNSPTYAVGKIADILRREKGEDVDINDVADEDIIRVASDDEVTNGKFKPELKNSISDSRQESEENMSGVEDGLPSDQDHDEHEEHESEYEEHEEHEPEHENMGSLEGDMDELETFHAKMIYLLCGIGDYSSKTPPASHQKPKTTFSSLSKIKHNTGRGSPRADGEGDLQDARCGHCEALIRSAQSRKECSQCKLICHLACHSVCNHSTTPGVLSVPFKTAFFH